MSRGKGLLSNLYSTIVGTVDKAVPQSLKPLWMSPAGPRTVFFWAPFFKWGLVFAGLGDIINRPPQNISLNQCCVIAVTGLIWSRYSLVIIPKNYSLFAVNIVVFITQGYLVYRALKWKNENPTQVQYDFLNEQEISWYNYLG